MDKFNIVKYRNMREILYIKKRVQTRRNLHQAIDINNYNSKYYFNGYRYKYIDY